MGIFRWTAATGSLLLTEGGSIDLSATAVSGDGSVIVGRTGAGGNHSLTAVGAFRWTAADGIRLLGELPGAVRQGFQSSASAVSADGSVVVGVADSDAGTKAFRWSVSEGMIGLGYLPGAPQLLNESSRMGVSADGSIVVGSFSYGAWNRTFIWDAAHGMRDLQAVLEGEHGLDLDGWRLIDAQAVSADGRVVVGHAFSPSGAIFAYRASIPEPMLVVHLAVAGLLLRRRTSRSDHDGR